MRRPELYGHLVELVYQQHACSFTDYASREFVVLSGFTVTHEAQCHLLQLTVSHNLLPVYGESRLCNCHHT